MRTTNEVKKAAAAAGGWARVVMVGAVLAGSAAMACVEPTLFGPTAQSIFLLAAGYLFGAVTGNGGTK